MFMLRIISWLHQATSPHAIERQRKFLSNKKSYPVRTKRKSYLSANCIISKQYDVYVLLLALALPK